MTLAATLAAIFASSALAQTTYEATADAHVKSANPNNNYPSGTVYTENTASGVTDSYFKFNLAGNASVKSALFKFKAHSGSTPSLTATFYPVTDTTPSWTETGVTWNNRPAQGSVAIGTAAIQSVMGDKIVDVTSYIKNELHAGRTTITIGSHKVDVGTGLIHIADRNNPSYPHPRLEVVPNNLPSVTLTAPLAGATFENPVTISATASDSDGTIAKVEFLADGVVVDEDGSAPYSVSVWLPAGTRSIQARAIDNDMGPATSPAVSIGVSPSLRVYGGGLFSVGLRADRTVWTWGDNSYGQLGTGNTDDRRAPIKVAGLTDVVAVSAGWVHMLALKSDGTVWALGFGTTGALGDGNGQTSYTPVQALNLNNIVAISAGHFHSMALRNDGTVWVWGHNSQGQLGDGGTVMRTTPYQLPGLSGVVQISAGKYESLVLKTDGTLLGWGQNASGQLGDGTTTQKLSPSVAAGGASGFQSVSLGIYHALARKGDGTLWSWGGNASGQLGDGTFTTPKLNPGTISLSGVTALVAGYEHSVALKSDGTVWTWGKNDRGQLGDGTTTMKSTPGQMLGLDSINYVAAGQYHTLAVRDDEAVFGSGENANYTLGDMTTIQRTKAVKLVSPLVSTPGRIAAKACFNWYGQTTIPAGLNDAVAISAGSEFALALRADGTVTAWGRNAEGQCNVPAGLSDVIQISAGTYNGIALKGDGTVVPWGDVVHPCTQCTMPPGVDNVVEVSVGFGHFIVLKNDGTVVTWGRDWFGQATVPPGLSGVVAVSAGLEQNVVLKSDGTMVTWGRNDYGQATIPPAINNNIAAISAGDWHGIAVKSDGTLVGWGFNNWGSLDIPAGLVVRGVDAGGIANLAITPARTLAGWGDTYCWTMTNFGAGIANLGDVSAGGLTMILRKPPFIPLLKTNPVTDVAVIGGSAQFKVVAISEDPVTYQWQFNGIDIPGATSATLTLNNVQQANLGMYRCRVSNVWGTITSTEAPLLQLMPPVITSHPQPPFQRVPPGTQLGYTAAFTAMAQQKYPVTVTWKRNGIPYFGGEFIAQFNTEGVHLVEVANAAGTTVSDPAILRVSSPGSVQGWGDNTYSQSFVPYGTTEIAAVAAGQGHSLYVRDDGTVFGTGRNDSGQINIPAGLNNVVAVAAGHCASFALKRDGTVVAWGGCAGEITIPAGLNDAIAISAREYHGLALRRNGTVVSWGLGFELVPEGLDNVIAIAAGNEFSMALKSDGSVVLWDGPYGPSEVVSNPPELNQIVAIAAGAYHALAVQSDGTVLAWGNNYYGETSVPPGLNNVMKVFGGNSFSLALKNDGTVVGWGDNSAGQVSIPAGLDQVKLLAAGDAHVLAGRFSSKIEYYPIEPWRDILLVYRANHPDSVELKNYYVANRPMMAGANQLGITCTTIDPRNMTTPEQYTWLAMDETIHTNNYESELWPQYQQWLTANPTKRPQYVIFFLKMPTRTFDPPLGGNTVLSLSSLLRSRIGGIPPFIHYINMGNIYMNNTYAQEDPIWGAWDLQVCKDYVDKLAYFGNTYSPGQLVIRPSRGGYANNTYYFDDKRHETCPWDYQYPWGAAETTRTLIPTIDPTATVVYVSELNEPNITSGGNVAGYMTWGAHSAGHNDECLGLQGAYAGIVRWTEGTSGWWILNTIESYNGFRRPAGGHGNVCNWWTPGSWNWGTAQPPHLVNTPVGGVGHVNEPGGGGIGNNDLYYGLWAKGRNFGNCAWSSSFGVPVVVGDPLVGR